MDADETISSFCHSLNSCERMDVWLLSYLSCCSLHDAPTEPMSLWGAAHHNSAVREDKFESKLAWDFFFFFKKSQFPADVFSILSPVLFNHGGFKCPKLMRKTATATQNAFEPEKLFKNVGKHPDGCCSSIQMSLRCPWFWMAVFLCWFERLYLNGELVLLLLNRFPTSISRPHWKIQKQQSAFWMFPRRALSVHKVLK